MICLALTPERVEELHLPQQAVENTAVFGTAFTVSIDARKDITTGISAADRATTIHVAIDPKSKPTDLARPGHIFPLKAVRGGVLRRAGQTEGSVDLARLAGLQPAGVICEIMMKEHTEAALPYHKTVKRKLYHSTGLDDMDFITYFETSKLEDFHSLILALEKVKEFQYTRRFGHPIWLGTAKGLDEIIEILAQ